MEAVAALLGLVAGVLLCALVLLVQRSRSTPTPPVAPLPQGLTYVPSAVDVIHALPVAVAVVDGQDDVVLANRAAVLLGVVRDDRVPVAELRRLVRDTRRSGTAHEAELELAASRLGRVPEAVRARLAPLGGLGHVALLVEDVTEARRVEAVRRDFVANVSHELKTPVGAMALLSEALQDAGHDPVAVGRFAGRMRHEADRLSRLVQELIDLSRLQGAEPLPELVPVAIGTVVAEAVDRTRAAAAAKDIQLAVAAQPGLVVRGVEAQLATALTNLLANAVAYSPPGTTIAIGARARSGFAEIAVTDSGIGIPRSDRSRVFERFYRVDQSRASATGGTGLGLAIVKHVASNHGGAVTVWSEEGLGSTFTLRIPMATDAHQPVDDEAGPERPPVPPLHSRSTPEDGPAGAAPVNENLQKGRS